MSKFLDLKKRFFTAIIGVILLIFLLFYHFWTMGLAFFIILFVSILEFSILLKLSKSMTIWIISSALFSYVVVFLVVLGWVSPYAISLIFIVIFMSILFHLYVKNEEVLNQMMQSVFAYVFILLPFCLIPIIGFFRGPFEPSLVMGLLLITWSMDVGGYFSGILVGKNKLFERISPKKSWEGLFGGIILAVIILSIYGYYLAILPLWQWIVLAIVTGLSSVLGDLVESLIKRKVKIKDSGYSLPGHGGFLDRFDSLLVATPFYLALLVIFLKF